MGRKEGNVVKGIEEDGREKEGKGQEEGVVKVSPPQQFSKVGAYATLQKPL